MSAALERLGRYEVVMPLGRGGMGEVFVVRLRGEADFQRWFAAKRIRAEHAADERLLAMFFDEARTAACLHSPFVVPVLDVGRDDAGRPFMIMELVLGASAGQLARTGPLPAPVVLAIAVDAARGLADAHAALDPYGRPLGVVHRDVSPGNVLVGLDGRARVGDFGVARAARRLVASAVGELKGTFAYFSPEQASGEADPQSDVFALGVVLWELLSGRRLFAAPSVAETLEAVATLPIPPLDGLAPRAVADVIARALARDRRRRYLRAADFGEALGDAAAASGLDRASAAEIGERARRAGQETLERLDALRTGPRADSAALAEAATDPWQEVPATRPSGRRGDIDAPTDPDPSLADRVRGRR